MALPPNPSVRERDRRWPPHESTWYQRARVVLPREPRPAVSRIPTPRLAFRKGRLSERSRRAGLRLDNSRAIEVSASDSPAVRLEHLRCDRPTLVLPGANRRGDSARNGSIVNTPFIDRPVRPAFFTKRKRAVHKQLTQREFVRQSSIVRLQKIQKSTKARHHGAQSTS